MQTEATTSPFLDTRQAAGYLGLRPSTLECWRTTGGGPPFKKFGRRVFYDRDDLESWVKAQHRTSTSDPGPDAR